MAERDEARLLARIESERLAVQQHAVWPRRCAFRLGVGVPDIGTNLHEVASACREGETETAVKWVTLVHKRIIANQERETVSIEQTYLESGGRGKPDKRPGRDIDGEVIGVGTGRDR